MSNLQQISLILVNPQMGENIGAAARAMGNFGLRDLRLVNPRDGWPNDRAMAMSSGAFDYMDEVRVFDSLSAALEDINYAYATTARPRHMVKPVVTPRAAAAETTAQTGANTDTKAAFVFGAERTGLENEDIALCQTIVQAETNPDFSSLNLGQCVLMVAYELFNANLSDSDLDLNSNSTESAQKTDQTPPAPMAEFDNLFKRLEASLESGGFFRDEGLRPSVTRNLRTTLLRAGMTPQEIKTFHGVLRALVDPR